MTEQQQVAEALRKQRKRSGVGITAAAAGAGISVDTLRRYERGEREPSFTTVRALLAAYDADWVGFLEEVGA